MKPVRAFLQFPWGFPDSPFYKYLLRNPPEGIHYVNSPSTEGSIVNKNKFAFLGHIKKVIREVARTFYPTLPNAKKIQFQKPYDLVHCAHCLTYTKKPWIIDIEYRSQMWVSGVPAKGSVKQVEKLLLSKNCKKILPWTEACKKEIQETFRNKRIDEKMEVLYPGVPFFDITKKKHEGINLLYVGRYFYEKGGLHALYIMDKLTKQFDHVKGIIVSETPQHLKERYSLNRKIKFIDLISQEKLLEEIYSISDIFIYPGYSDSFGFMIPEVMSFGIPAITASGYSKDEVIEHGKTGIIVQTDKKVDFRRLNDKVFLEMFTQQAIRLIKDKKLRETMGKKAKEEVQYGKFSIEKRNKRLKEIYQEVLS